MSRSADQRAENDFSAGRYFDDHATIAVYSRENSEDTNSSIEKSAQSTLTHGSDISCSTKYPAFTGVSDQKSPVSSPREYPIWKKRLILLVITFAGSIGPTANTLYLPGLSQVQSDMHASYTAVNASLAATNLATAIFPLFWAAVSTNYGRKLPFLVALALAAVSNVCAGLSMNAGMLIAFRGLGGAGASASMAICAGIITDIYDGKQQGSAFTTFTMGPFLGTCVGPIIGGRLAETFGWRSILYFMAAYAVLAWILVLVFVPETSKINDITLNQSASDTNEKQQNPRHRDLTPSRIRDIKLLGALKFYSFPNVLLICLVSGLSYFVFYFNNTAFTWIYSEQYDLKPSNFSLAYLVFPTGCVVGSLLGGRLSDRAYKRKTFAARNNIEANANTKEPNFEMRLGIGMLGTCFVVWIGCLSVFGWCVQKKLHFAYGIACEFAVNTCYSAAMVITATYLINSFEDHSSSVNACNTLARYTLAAVGELFASDLLAAIPAGVLYTVLGLALFFSSLSIIYVKVNPQKWKRMREERLHQQTG